MNNKINELMYAINEKDMELFDVIDGIIDASRKNNKSEVVNAIACMDYNCIDVDYMIFDYWNDNNYISLCYNMDDEGNWDECKTWYNYNTFVYDNIHDRYDVKRLLESLYNTNAIDTLEKIISEVYYNIELFY